MNEGTATAIVILTSVAALASTATLVGGVVILVKLNKKIQDIETKVEKSKDLTKKFVRDLANL